MALVKRYRVFKADLAGYAEVPFAEFRDRLAPLRSRTAWTPEETEYVRTLAAAGAGFALQRHFGLQHGPAAAALGEAPLPPEPLTRPELDRHLGALLQNCARDGWPARRYLAFAAYLASDATPADLAAREPAEDGPCAARALRAGGAPDLRLVRDRFADMYRGAGPGYRRVVDERLARAAEAARAGPVRPLGGAPLAGGAEGAPLDDEVEGARLEADLLKSFGRRGP